MLHLSNISHEYDKETILHDISLTIENDTFNVITGES